MVRSRTLLWLVGSVALSVACAKQGEGERCDRQGSVDEDCADGLVCVPDKDLVTEGADRCCPSSLADFTDDRCRRSGFGTGGDDGTGGQGGAGTGGSGTGGGATGGAGTGGFVSTECLYTSQCAEGLICGPTGQCIPECAGDRDCSATQRCDNGTCVAE